MCGGAFRDVPFAAESEMQDGVLTCDGCPRVYPVINGVPRLLPDALAHVLPSMHSEFFARHAEAMAPYLRRCSPDEAGRALDAKRRTIASYSYQWRKFREMFPHWEDIFRWSVTPLEPSFFRGRVGLDAGCGFGRSLFHAASYGAEVIGLDLSEAVEAAHDNTRHLAGAHVVQGDIFHPPVRPGTLDFVYSIGVLQHLPDPRGGFIGLTRLLAPKAPAFVWVYPRGRGRQIALFSLMRAVSTRMPLPMVDLLALGLAAAQWLMWITPYRVLSRFAATRPIASRVPFALYARFPFRVLHTDWVDGLSVPLVAYYTATDIRGWYEDAALERVQLANPWDGRAIGYARDA